MELSKKKCIPCEGGTSPLKAEKIADYISELHDKWEVVDNKKIKKEFKFSAKGGSASGGKNPFQQAIEFLNKIAKIAEQENHHPDIHIYYNRVLIELWTHEIGGLSENDFILAAKIDELL